MSDTKALIKYVSDRMNDGPNITFGKPTVLDLVAALESAEANVARLNKMVDWLAEKLSDCPQVFTNCAVDCAECRKEAASRAVADAESSEKVPCHACKGKGGAEYEPGLLSYVCNVCGGTGQTERRAVAAGEE